MKSFELIIIDKGSMRLDTDDGRKSHYFFCDIRKNAHNCSVFLSIVVEKKRPVARFRVMRCHRSNI